MVQDTGLRDEALGYGVQGLGLRVCVQRLGVSPRLSVTTWVQSLWSRVWVLGLRFEGFWFTVSSLESRVSGSETLNPVQGSGFMNQCSLVAVF